jgi:hypothetical protein
VFTPQYVQAFMGYDAELAGKTQLPGALLLILLMPLAGLLVKRIQARWLIGVGFLLSVWRHSTSRCSRATVLSQYDERHEWAAFSSRT